ncbi:hypothetical protein ACWC10_25475 [Streptomyces sp. NPDC001595]|uniref:hypothetical protein n=1 Tax=Streptomyces sp. NPDC001532 TaxID=3154520 RepID=UPI00332067B9
MGLDITVMIADWSWLTEVPPGRRLTRLRDAWYDDGTGWWDRDAPAVESGLDWPRGPHSGRFAVYEFPRTCGSFKPHFWAGQRWESFREHIAAPMRAEWDALLLELVWDGLDGTARHTEPGLFGDDEDDPDAHGQGVLLARSPGTVRELGARWERIRPGLDGARQAFTEHAAAPEGWVGDFDAFKELLEGWGQVLAEAAGRGWGVVGLSE